MHEPYEIDTEVAPRRLRDMMMKGLTRRPKELKNVPRARGSDIGPRTKKIERVNLGCSLGSAYTGEQTPKLE